MEICSNNNNNDKSIKLGNINNNSVEININESNKGHNQIQSQDLRGETMICICERRKWKKHMSLKYNSIFKEKKLIGRRRS